MSERNATEATFSAELESVVSIVRMELSKRPHVGTIDASDIRAALQAAGIGSSPKSVEPSQEATGWRDRLVALADRGDADARDIYAEIRALENRLNSRGHCGVWMDRILKCSQCGHEEFAA